MLFGNLKLLISAKEQSELNPPPHQTLSGVVDSFWKTTLAIHFQLVIVALFFTTSGISKGALSNLKPALYIYGMPKVYPDCRGNKWKEYTDHKIYRFWTELPQSTCNEWMDARLGQQGGTGARYGFLVNNLLDNKQRFTWHGWVATKRPLLCYRFICKPEEKSGRPKKSLNKSERIATVLWSFT